MPNDYSTVCIARGVIALGGILTIGACEPARGPAGQGVVGQNNSCARSLFTSPSLQQVFADCGNGSGSPPAGPVAPSQQEMVQMPARPPVASASPRQEELAQLGAKQPTERSPQAENHFVTYQCNDTGRSTIMVDRVNKVVRTNTPVGRFRCVETVTDGVTAPTATQASCNVPLMGNFASSVVVRQSVKIKGDVVTWGGEVTGNAYFKATGGNQNLYQRLNLANGASVDMDGHVGHCQKVNQ